MAIMKEKCPVCGGTIVIPEKMNVGECDSCGTQFTLSDLQRMKETQINITEEDDEEEEAEEEFRNYRTALSTDNITHENINDLCKKAEIALESEQW